MSWSSKPMRTCIPQDKHKQTEKIKANTKRETTQVEGKTAVDYRLGIFMRGDRKTETPTSEKN